MARFWWVNHSQTFRQEIDGGYLWSPKNETNGSRSQFYDNMRQVTPNDLVLSFADTRIVFVGRVVDFALSAPKPSEFGSTGSNWANEGWLLPVNWRLLDNPVRPKDFIERLAPMLPAKYSPISPQTGNGNQKAYLAEITQSVFHLILHEGGVSDPIFDTRDESSFSNIVASLEREVENQIQENRTLSSTEKGQWLDVDKASLERTSAV
jgi:putative restriction endonuclease